MGSVVLVELVDDVVGLLVEVDVLDELLVDDVVGLLVEVDDDVLDELLVDDVLVEVVVVLGAAPACDATRGSATPARTARTSCAALV